MSRTGTALGVEHQSHLFSHLLAGVQHFRDILHQYLEWICFCEGEVPDQVPQLGREGEEVAFLRVGPLTGRDLERWDRLQEACK